MQVPLAPFFMDKSRYMRKMHTILGTKKQMSQAFIEGVRVPITYIEAGPCVVTQVKNLKKDGYWAIQLGFGAKKINKVTKSLQGHLKGVTKNKMTPRFLREVRVSEGLKMKVGDEVKISDIFSEGDKISVTGISKGKGFAGVMKRWGFAGGPKTHGQSDRERAPGSIGQGTTPGRVHKGKKMPGRMGTDRVTIKNIRVVSVDSDKNLLTVSGPVPGAPNSLLIVRKLTSGKLRDLVQRGGSKEKVGEKVAKRGDKGGNGEAGETQSE